MGLIPGPTFLLNNPMDWKGFMLGPRLRESEIKKKVWALQKSAFLLRVYKYTVHIKYMRVHRVRTRKPAVDRSPSSGAPHK